MQINLKITSRVLVLLLTGFFLTSCSSDVEETEVPEPTDPNACVTVSFATTVQPIINSSCIECHNGSQSPDLRTFEGVSASANRVKTRVANRTMPLGGSLTDDEIKAIVCWVDGGALDN